MHPEETLALFVIFYLALVVAVAFPLALLRETSALQNPADNWDKAAAELAQLILDARLLVFVQLPFVILLAWCALIKIQEWTGDWGALGGLALVIAPIVLGAYADVRRLLTIAPLQAFRRLTIFWAAGFVICVTIWAIWASTGRYPSWSDQVWPAAPCIFSLCLVPFLIFKVLRYAKNLDQCSQTLANVLNQTKQPFVQYFCPKCSQEFARHGACPDCSEDLTESGWCRDCDGHWHLQIGASCPEHSVPLVSGEKHLAPLDVAKLVARGNIKVTASPSAMGTPGATLARPCMPEDATSQ
ncbi:MAG: hypothetical protein NTU53_02200 [Planctomycetota bacterium]|nr:hypothetical protein [Planctomycetota bacterium]